ncbi:MAG: type II toxin-antitoxin system HicA family toxin [Atribacterota bacterium]|nr:type II toxin-antitoxin system HicA family toxin [Atribacterota bacterium]
MGILSNISGKKAAKIFCKIGFFVDHNTGSHMILYHAVPGHKELAPGLLRGLIRSAGIEVEEFIKMK